MNTESNTAAASTTNVVAKTPFFDDKFKQGLGTAFKTGLVMTALIAPGVATILAMQAIANRK